MTGGSGRLQKRVSTAASRVAVVVALVASFVAVVPAASVSAAVTNPFTPIYTSQQNGAISLIGNSQMSCPTSASTCATARTAAIVTGSSNSAIDNNSFNMVFLDQDADGTTSNSTSADLALPAGSVVLYARLVWGGRLIAGTGGAAPIGDTHLIKFRTPAQTAYSTLTASTYFAPSLTSSDASPYQASIDVTTAVTAGGNGTYWGADVRAGTGADRYAGWSLVVAYRNPALPLRDLSIFQGFANVNTNPADDEVTIPISGFLTPAVGTVNASVGFVTWEGDRGLTGESARLNNTLLSDAVRPSNNFFNSGISDAGVNVTARNASFPNTFGVDIARVVANGVLPNNATSTTLQVATAADFFYPGILTTQIDLYTPAFNPVSKTVTDLSGNSPAQVGDTLEYQVSFTNTGLDDADSSVVTDVLAVNQTFVPGSINVTASPAAGTTGPKTDAAGDDTAEYDAGTRTVRVRIGTGAGAALTAGGRLSVNATATFKFRAVLARPAAGTTMANVATLAYVARTLGTRYTFTGNVVNTQVAALADLAVTKSSSPTSVNAGGTVQYPITVTNNGPTAATGVSVVDTLPATLTFVSAAAPPGTSCSASGQVVTCDGGTLANGASLTFTINASVPAATPAGSVVNTVRVVSATSDDTPINDTAAATTTITRSADMVALKTVLPTGPVAAGAQLTYTITARNDGPSTATSATLTDPVPVGTTIEQPSTDIVVTSPTGACSLSGGSVLCTVATLAPGASLTATVKVRIGSGFIAANLTNTATATSAVTDPTTPGNNTSSVSNPIVRQADVSIAKAVAPGTANAGSNVTYTLTVSNSGPSDAQGVTVADPAVAGLTLTSAAPSRGSCTITAGALSCAIGLLSPGSSATVTLQATVDQARAVGPLTNTATAASATTPDPDSTNNSRTATLQVTASADVSIAKIGPNTITSGSTGNQYTLTVANAGPSQATGVTISDTLPSGVLFTSSPDGCTAVGQVVTCLVGTLAANGTPAVRHIVFSAGAMPASVSNTATVAATTADPVSANNTSEFVSSGAAVADVAVTKAISPAPLVAGGPVTFTMVVRNNGPSPALGVTLDDPVPANVVITSVVPGSGTCDPAPAVHCSLGILANGQAVTVTATGTIAANAAGGTQLSNTATAASTSPTDPTQSNNTATAAGTVTTSADVGVTLTPTNPTITAGSVEHYLLHVVNNGPSVARGVVVTGQVPPGVVPIVGSSGGACVLTGQIVTCNLGDLPPGFSTIPDITLDATVIASDPAGTISGTAIVGSQTPDSNAANDTSTAVITVITSADLAVSKQAPAALVSGGEATYTITVTNNGPSDAVDAQLNDTLPAGLTPVSVSVSTGSCSTTGQVIACTAARLPAGSTMVASVRTQVGTSVGGSTTNTATTTSGTSDPNTANNSSSVTTPVTQAAHLELSKSATPEPVSAGASITYSLTATNTGPSIATAVVLTDPLPGGLTVLPNGVTAPVGATCTVTGASTGISCDLGAVPPGTSRTVSVNALVPSTATDQSIVTNVATVVSSTPDPVPGPRTASVATTVVTTADLAMLKTPLDRGVDAGDQHGYLLTVTNNGPSVARAVTISDPVPPGTTFVSAVPTNGTCDGTAPSVSCAIGDLLPGQVATVQLTVLLAPNLGETTLTNAASTSSLTNDPDTTNNTSSVSQVVTRRSDLALTKVITSGPLIAGAPIVYSLTLTNRGPSDALNAVIDDPLPAGTTLGSATASDNGTCEVVSPAPPDTPNPTAPTAPPSTRCTWPQLPVGQTRTMTLTLGLPADTATGTTITNTATATSFAVDPNPNTATATATGTVVTSADLSVSKSLISGTPVAGGSVRWQIVVRNAGPSVALGATLADPALAGVTFTSATSTVGTCTITGGDACSFGDLAVGAVATVTLAGSIDPAYGSDTLINSVSVSSSTPDPVASNNSASSTTTVATSADLVVVKTAGPGAFVAGSTVQWTITVTNQGPSISKSVNVSDPIPTGLVGVSATTSTGSGCTIAASVACALGDLPAQGAATVTISGTLAADYSSGTATNTARAIAGTPDPDQSNNTSAVSTPVATSADVSISKTGPASAAPGEPITWQLAVVNHGPSVAQAVVVTDTLPAAVLSPRATFGGNGCTITAGQVRCELGAVPVTDGTLATTQVVTITGTIDPDATDASITNSASVSSVTTPDPVPGNNTSPDAVTTLTPLAEVSIVKTASTSPIVPGTTVAWTVAVSNAGPSVARAVTVTDELPAGVTAPTATAVVGGVSTPCTITGTTISCSLGDLAPATPVRIDITGAVDQGLAVATLDNTAALTTSTPDPTPDDHTSTSSTPVVASANLRIAKSVDLTDGLPVAGGPIHFILAVDNNGPSAADDVEVRDTLPAEIIAASVVVTPSSCTFVGATLDVACSLGTLASGGHVDISIRGTLESTAADVSNTAAVNSSTGDPDLANNSSTAEAVSDQLADVSITKTAPASVLAGQRITWTLTVGNSGPSVATGLNITDAVPADVTDVAVTGAGADCPSATSLPCTVASLPVGATATVTVSATVPSGTALTSLANSAQVTAATPDPVGGNNNASVSTDVGRQSALSVEKVADPSPLVPGRDGEYTITVSNAGPSDAEATLLGDALDDALTPSGPAVPSQGTCDYSGAQLGCALGVIPANASATVRVPVKVDAATTKTSIVNSATASTSTPGSPPATGTADSEVVPLADLTLTKTGPAQVTAGTAIAWNLAVSNDGPSVAADVVVVDHLPPGLGAMSIVASQGTCVQDLALETITCAVGNLAPGSSVAIQVSGTVPADSPVTPLLNSATVTSPVNEPSSGPDGRSASSTTEVVTQADVSIVKRALVDPAVPGEAVHWTMTVSNNGPSVARAVHVTEDLPAGLSNLVITPPPTAPSTTTCDPVAATCEIAALDVGLTGAVTFDVTADLAADVTTPRLTNSAGVSAATTDDDLGNNQASVTIAVAASADLTITKTGPASAVRGTTMSWTITVVNHGPSVAGAVIVTDRLPAGLTGITADGPNPTSCTITATDIRCALGDVPPGAPTLTIAVAATVTPDFAGDTLVNTASVAGTTVDPNPEDDVATSTTAITSFASLTLTKTGPSSAVAGGTIEWLITVTNAGPSVARAVLVVDTVPAGVIGAEGIPSVGTCDAVIHCAVGELAVGAVVTVVVRGTVDPAWTSGPIVNAATVVSPDQPLTGPPTPVVTDVTRSADVSLTKTLASGGTVAGGPVSWTVTVANAGPSTAADVVVTDAIPAAVLGAQATSTAGTSAVDSGTVRCALGTVGSAPVTITVSGTIAPAFRGTLTNAASASSSTPDPDPTNGDASVSSTVGGSIDLAITKSVDRPQGLVGSRATFTVVASNGGVSSAANVVVDDQLPAGLTFVAARPSSGTFDPTTRRWTIGVLSPGATATMAVDVSLDAPGRHTNVVIIGQTPNAATNALTLAGDVEVRLDNNTASATIEAIQPGNELPATGSEAWVLVRAALATIVAGAFVVFAVRRRRVRRAH